ncbi:MAG: hypothetical protein AAGA56_00815, partial [Myxococcota bacterium]
VGEALERGSIELIDIDDESPERGTRVPLRFHIFDGGAVYVPDHTLALRPMHPLRSGTRYAAVVKRSLTPSLTLDTEPAFDAAVVAGAEPRAREAGQALAALGHPPKSLAGLTSFVTQDAETTTRRFFEGIGSAAPRILTVAREPALDRPAFEAYVGYYCTPNYQTELERAPWVEHPGGTIAEDAEGRPQPSAVPPTSRYHTAACGDQLRARFSLAVPRSSPPGPLPLLVYAHGTLGDALTVLARRGFADLATAAGYVVASTDQPLHGGDDRTSARPGSDVRIKPRIGPFPLPIPGAKDGLPAAMAFYNFLHPSTLRDNMRQAAADQSLLARTLLAANWSRLGLSALSLRKTYVAAGHSQGAPSAALVGAYDPRVEGVLVSACTGDFSTNAVSRGDVRRGAGLIAPLLGIDADELNPFHPFATAVQMLFDPVDPQSTGRLYRTGRPRSVLAVMGQRDSMVVEAAADAFAGALGLTPVGAPTPPSFPRLAARPSQPQVKANAAGGRATFGALVLSPAGPEGHFVAFENGRGRQTMREFLRELAVGPPPPAIRWPAR